MKTSMVFFAGVLVVLLGARAEAVNHASRITPIQQVIVMLQNMLEQGKREKHDEQVHFASFKQFCDDTSVDKKRSIAEAEETIEKLTADIEKHTTTAARLTKEIAGHDADIAAWTGDSKAAANVRAIEQGDYTASHKDHTESIDALARAVTVMKKRAKNVPQTAGSLAQLSSLKALALVPPTAKRAIDTFLLQDPVAAPEAAGYEFQSHGIVDMLSKLHDKFKDERNELEKTEMNSKHAHDLLQQDLKSQVDQSTVDRDGKAEFKAKTLEAKADAEGARKDTNATMEEDKKYLSDLTATCAQKSKDFESRQQLRTEEMEALQKAISIIESDKVTVTGDKHLPVLAQTKAAAFAQLRASGGSGADKSKTLMVEYLQQRARTLKSNILLSIAQKASEDPFAKVRTMIKDLIVRLMEEAGEEADHKGFCDAELSTNEQTRKEKTSHVESLKAEIDQLDASIFKLNEDMKSLREAIVALDKAMAEATEYRQKEKAENEQTIAESKDAQTAVAQALTVLKEFYSKAGDATALLQQQPEVPKIFEDSYKGKQAESGGVIGMLEVIESDFARLEADTTAAEANAAKEYDTFMTDSKEDKAAKETDIEHKTTKEQDENQALVVANKDLSGTQKELAAALEYFDKLKPSCVDSGVSYEERKVRREEEIASLQEALTILNSGGK